MLCSAVIILCQDEQLIAAKTSFRFKTHSQQDATYKAMRRHLKRGEFLLPCKMQKSNTVVPPSGKYIVLCKLQYKETTHTQFKEMI